MMKTLREMLSEEENTNESDRNIFFWLIGWFNECVSLSLSDVSLRLCLG